MNDTKGRLVVIGSGIKAVAHFTLEAQAHIQQADIVLYAAADPVTDLWIESQNPNAFDLYQYYADDKGRVITYVQMIERIMAEVRAGKYVCALFYGHPGVFVTPSHNAIEIARAEGYDAVMLPAVSAEDCLYADLGVDPSVPGLQIYEATDFLLRRRKVDTTANFMLWQVGCIGDLGFKFAGYENDKFDVLIDYLEELYGPDHLAINYVANMFYGPPQIDRHVIADYRNPDVKAKVSGISTFFIPAKDGIQSDAGMLAKLGLAKVSEARRNPLICDREDYPVLAEIARRNNHNHRVPPGYKYSFASEALYQTLLKLALDQRAQREFRASPKIYLEACVGLTADERRSLLHQHTGVTRMMFKRDPNLEAVRFVGAALLDPGLAREYYNRQVTAAQAVADRTIPVGEYEGVVASWLRQQGYAATPSAVTRAMAEVHTSKDSLIEA
ncbi:SAM-dependent methyltransferase [Janthinobacterium lividum]|uniref:SAM-dependent methyltransferase n=1 Tax=Janthinobacterium lividum TaxID=29581 RepID=UPI00068B5F86|nr:SAM-dependent methyltransferase [Janthinobacterium lividum]